jgi:L-aspartate oxidase
MQAQGVAHMGLDLTPIDAQTLQRRFPNILERCHNFGINPEHQPIPVAPAAHYWMGGVATDLKATTSLPGLYAVGEVACTGLHGANRLASNSLMECLVFARQLRDIDLGDPLSKATTEERRTETPSDNVQDHQAFSEQELSQSIQWLRSECWRVAGVDRSAHGMRDVLTTLQKATPILEAMTPLKLMQQQHPERSTLLDESRRAELNLMLDLLHRQQASSLLLEACLFRKESRGGHFRNDTPAPLPQWCRHSRQIKGQAIGTRAVTS